MICEWHFVPRVPDSKRGFSNQTHWPSTYCLALTLSTAFTTKSRLVQKLSLKMCSFSGAALAFNDSNLTSLFIFLPTLQAVSHLLDPTCSLLNKNCLLRLLISILSSSVTVILPPLVESPINENILINSHPSAPAPITNELDLNAFSTNSSPKRIL